MLDLDTELGSLVKEELQRGFYAQAVNARARQLRIAEANARLEHAHIEGVGQHVASIDAFAFIDWERRNPGITRDKDWLKSLLRDNPECRVQTSSAKTQVSFAGMDFNPSENTGICPFPKGTGDSEQEPASQISNLQSPISPSDTFPPSHLPTFAPSDSLPND
jgi:hypothetical protein